MGSSSYLCNRSNVTMLQGLKGTRGYSITRLYLYLYLYPTRKFLLLGRVASSTYRPPFSKNSNIQKVEMQHFCNVNHPKQQQKSNSLWNWSDQVNLRQLLIEYHIYLCQNSKRNFTCHPHYRQKKSQKKKTIAKIFPNPWFGMQWHHIFLRHWRHVVVWTVRFKLNYFLWFNPEITLTYFHFSMVDVHLVQKKLDDHQPNKQASLFLSFHSAF